MKKITRVMYLCLCVVISIICISLTAFAHSGRTDSRGGHKDNKNKSGLGSYHYHCGGYPPHLHSDGYCPYTEAAPSNDYSTYKEVVPTKVNINVEKNSLKKGEEISIDASVYPANSNNTDVILESSNSNVVSISGNTLKAVGFGTAVITAKSSNNIVNSVTITVKEIMAETISIDDSKDSLFVGETMQLTASIKPNDTDNKTTEWSSSNETIATIDSNGNVKAIAVGSTTISVKTSNGKTSSKVIKTKEVIAEKIEIICDQSIIDGDYCKAEVVFYPENTTAKDIKWEISDEKIATIDGKGNIQSVGVGKVTITAVQKDVKASFDLEVKPKKVESIYIEAEIGDKLYKGDFVNFKATVSPEDATYPQVYWSVSDEEVAIIDENGVLEALSVGETIVTAYTEDGCTETYEIKVHHTPQSILAVIAGGLVVAFGSVFGAKKYKGAKKE